LANKPIVEELSSLQTQIKAINSKISENLKILKKTNQEPSVKD
jgi:hypothetical protein